jgi:hypothetical protein
MKKDEIIDLVLEERERQDGKWGIQAHSLDHWFVILGEEVGELAREIFELDLDKDDPYDKLRDEAVQCAAVIFAILENAL